MTKLRALSLHSIHAPGKMSTKFVRFQIMAGFFLVVAVVLVWRFVASKPQIDPRLVERATQLEMDRLALRAAHLQRNADLLFYGCAGGISILGVSALIMAGGAQIVKMKRASVHVYKIGESEIVIHDRDLSLAGPVAMGLMNAEQLKQMNGGMEKAFELACTMADIQNRQIKALMHGSRTMPALPANTECISVAPVRIPTFRELVQAGELAPGKPMILGYVNGQPRRGSFLDIYSAAVAGESGSGKTSTMLFLMAGALLSGPVRFLGIDPHYPHPKSLGAKVKPLSDSGLIRMATFKDDMLQVLSDVEQMIDRRLKQTEQDETPVVLVIDELAFLNKTPMGANIAHTMERISTEGRKCAVYMLASSQTWLVARTGESSVVRDTLTSAYVHRIKPKQANLLLQDRDEAEKVKHFVKQAGQALLCPVGGESQIVSIPLTETIDLELVNNAVNKPVNSQPVDRSVDCLSQHTGLVKAGPVDLVDQVQKTLKNKGDFTALVQSTGLPAAYASRILNRKQPMSRNAEERFRAWLAR